MADLVIDQIAKSAKAGNPAKKPFLIWWCNQVPHLDGQLKYPVSEASLAQIPPAADLPVPANWKDDLASKPAYLATSRFVTKSATENYGGPGGYAKAANVRQHLREYHAAITDLDREIGRVLARLEDPDGDGDPSDSIADNTWVIFMGDNGWFTGHHRFTSKVLAYEESVRVPLIVRAPGVAPRTDDHLVLNIDLTQLLLDLAGAELPASLHGRNLRQLVEHPATPWRDHLYYEALTSELGSTAHEAVRTTTHKLIRTYPENGPAFTELYDLTTDPHELDNLAPSQTHQELLTELSSLLEQSRPPSD